MSKNQQLTGQTVSAHVLLVSQWHPVKNVLEPEQTSSGSGKRAWWICSEGHEYERVVREQTKYQTCPYCTGKKILPGFNDLGTLRPDIAAQWHPTKNIILPSTVALRSNQKAWWVCEKNHEYETSVDAKVGRNRGCPVCANKKVIVGVNSLSTTHPALATQWSDKNSQSSDEVTAGSHKKVWWVCEKNHEWEASPKKRATNQGCPYCAGNKVFQGFNDLKSQNPNIAKQWSQTNLKTPDQYTVGSEAKVQWKCDKNHEWEATINNRVSKNSNCPTCAAGESSSKAEKEIADYIKTLGVVTLTNVRNIIKPHELDIYVPEKKIAVEYNGLYWHSEKHKTQTYHYDKWQAVQKAGIQLIQIWEDDYNRNPELVKRMLAHKLGMSASQPVYARKTKVAPITNNEAKVFLGKNHIQGFATGSHYLALKLNDEIVAVLVLKTEVGNTLNIIRYATNQTVLGGFTKLLNKATSLYQPDKYVTFSDNTVSDGSLYENNGFTAEAQIKPDYMYIVKNERKHKFGYRLKKFRNAPDLKYVEGLTERELATLNNLPRVWDAGKTKWVKNVTQKQ